MLHEMPNSSQPIEIGDIHYRMCRQWDCDDLRPGDRQDRHAAADMPRSSHTVKS